MRVCVFCSANDNIDPQYFEETARLGRLIAEAGHELVFGGCNVGLMECVAKAAFLAGGRTIGVIPEKVESQVKPSEYISERIDVPNLSVRKQLMMDISDVFIALPGGIGTLDEIFSVAASHTIGYHNKKVILLNINGFWDGVKEMLRGLDREGMLRGELSDYILITDSIETALSNLGDCRTRCLD